MLTRNIAPETPDVQSSTASAAAQPEVVASVKTDETRPQLATKGAHEGHEALMAILAGGDGSSRPALYASQATQLVDLASEVELFHTPDGKAYATIHGDPPYGTWPLAARSFRLWLQRQFYTRTRRAPSAQALREALGVLEARALFDGAERVVSCRLAASGGEIYLDLANERREAVAITPSGWQVVTTPPVKFERLPGIAPLPHPIRGGNIEELRAFVNITSEQDWILMTAWLIAAFQPTGPYPILILHGEQGTAKSHGCRVLRNLVDPNDSPLRSVVREERDLMIAATNAWVVAFDNLSSLGPWLSDALCRLATGGGFSVRKLYTNQDEVLFHPQRPLLLNGIEDLATRGDLLDRAIVLHLPPIPRHKRQDEKKFWPAFKAAQPRILGALLDAVSTALRTVPQIKLDELPRMADFALWSCAAAPACAWHMPTEQGTLRDAEAFLYAYASNREAANDLALEASDVAQAVRELGDRVGVWCGTATHLLEALRTTVEGARAHSHTWPRSAHALSAALRRLTPNLRAVGVHIDFTREPGSGRRLIKLWKANPIA